MANGKKFRFKKWADDNKGIITIVMFGVVFLLLLWFVPSAMVASRKQKAYVEKYGENSITNETSEGLFWVNILMEEYNFTVEDIIEGDVNFGFDSVRVAKRSHLFFGKSYNYLKYIYKYNGKRYVGYYPIRIIEKDGVETIEGFIYK